MMGNIISMLAGIVIGISVTMIYIVCREDMTMKQKEGEKK